VTFPEHEKKNLGGIEKEKTTSCMVREEPPEVGGDIAVLGRISTKSTLKFLQTASQERKRGRHKRTEAAFGNTQNEIGRKGGGQESPAS